MKKQINSKQMLFEMMRKVNPDFIINEDIQNQPNSQIRYINYTKHLKT
jgi:glycerol-3-phosphate cytidylyltransferase-like family protein